MKKLMLLALLVPLASACSSTRAQTQVEVPALDVPPVPPRVIGPLPTSDLPAVEPVPDLPPAPAAPPKPAPKPTPKPETKPEAKPETPPDATSSQTNPPAVPPLRTPNAADGPEAAKAIQDVIDRTYKVLNVVDYGRLTSDRRANYDNAKSFLKQAEEALKTNDHALAKSLANRAEEIANLLRGR